MTLSIYLNLPVFEIPLSPNPQSFQITLGGVVYNMQLIFRDSDGNAGWTLDIMDSTQAPLVMGIPLVTGSDLLEQYGYLGFQGRLFVLSDGTPDPVPTFANLGITSHLYFQGFN